METAVAGRTILKAVAAFTTIGGFLMDWNKTHLFNPNWTPHAKFHDAMTILSGTLLGATSLYLLQKEEEDHAMLKVGAFLPAIFYLAQAGSFTFPGAEGMDAEFPEKIPAVGRIRLNEGPFSLVMLAALGTGYLLAKKGNE